MNFRQWVENAGIIDRVSEYLKEYPDATPAEIIGVLLNKRITPEDLSVHDKLEADEVVRAGGFMDVRHFIQWMTGKDPDAVAVRRIQIQQDKLSRFFH